jgi:hypothetical protein
MSRIVSMIATALLISGSAFAQTYVPPPAQGPTDPAAASIDASGRGEDLSWVSNPTGALTHLTIYSRGVNIGHVGKLALDRTGRPVRVRVVFNSGAPPVWIDAAMVRYDPEKKMITTQASVAEIEQLAHTRVP